MTGGENLLQYYIMGQRNDAIESSFYIDLASGSEVFLNMVWHRIKIQDDSITRIPTYPRGFLTDKVFLAS